MKCGIKALLITLAIATTGMSGRAGGPPAAKTPATKERADAPAPEAVKALMMTVRESVSIRPLRKISPAR
jgi:hypothetical protein